MSKRRVREAIETFCRVKSLNTDVGYELPRSRTFCHVIHSINHVTKFQLHHLITIPRLSRKLVYADKFSILGFET